MGTIIDIRNYVCKRRKMECNDFIANLIKNYFISAELKHCKLVPLRKFVYLKLICFPFSIIVSSQLH